MRFRAQFSRPDRSLTGCESHIYDAVQDISDVKRVHIGTASETRREGIQQITVEFTVTPVADSIDIQTVESSLEDVLPLGEGGEVVADELTA